MKTRNLILTIFAAAFSGSAVQAQPQPKIATPKLEIKAPNKAATVAAAKDESSPIAPLSDKTKLDFLKTVYQRLKAENTNWGIPESLAAPLVLSVLKPKISDQVRLIYYDEYESPLSANRYVEFPIAKNAQGGRISILFTPKESGAYLFDLSVDAPKAQNDSFYTLGIPPSSGRFLSSDLTIHLDQNKRLMTQRVSQAGNYAGHLVFVARFNGGEPNGVYILANTPWRFYRCEISRIKAL